MATTAPDDGHGMAASITLIAHLPEHGARHMRVPAQAGPGCCCCCCCCLHTLGSIAGAVIAPRLGERSRRDYSHLSLLAYWDEDEHIPDAPASPPANPEAITEDAPPLPVRHAPSPYAAEDGAAIALPRAGRSAATLFWWSMLPVVGLNLIGTCLTVGSGEAILAFLLIVALAFPLMQLAAVALTAFVLGVSARPDKRYQFRQLAKIFLGVVAGAVAGILAMFLIALLFTGFSGVSEWGPFALAGAIGTMVFFACCHWLVKQFRFDRLWTMTAMVFGVLALAGLYLFFVSRGFDGGGSAGLVWLGLTALVSGLYVVCALNRWVDHLWVLGGAMIGLLAVAVLDLIWFAWLGFGWMGEPDRPALGLLVEIGDALGVFPLLVLAGLALLALAAVRWYWSYGYGELGWIVLALTLGALLGILAVDRFQTGLATWGNFDRVWLVPVLLAVPASAAWLFVLMRRRARNPFQ